MSKGLFKRFVKNNGISWKWSTVGFHKSSTIRAREKHEWKKEVDTDTPGKEKGTKCVKR